MREGASPHKKEKYKRRDDERESSEETRLDESVRPAQEDAVTIKKGDYQALLDEARKIEEYTDKLLRQQAEFENTKKRLSRETVEAIDNANRDLITSLLPVLDNFERALNTLDSAGSGDRFSEGVILIYKQLKTVLEQAGLQKIDALNGEFDPYKHEAVSHVVSGEHPDNTVVEEMQAGYLFRKRLLRPSLVVVSKQLADAPVGEKEDATPLEEGEGIGDENAKTENE
ncbi:MAG: nucleotide exchange factor GrpE [Candidatus Omnitrophica bacterium]|nr:nucleotide exchange factor GrpE [Candidatus Omnitrophota bacterium]